MIKQHCHWAIPAGEVKDGSRHTHLSLQMASSLSGGGAQRTGYLALMAAAHVSWLEPKPHRGIEQGGFAALVLHHQHGC